MWNLRYQVCENSPPVCTLYYGKGKVCARVDVYLISIKILFFCFVFLVIIESDDSGTKITKIVIGLMLNVKNPDRYIRVYKDLFHNRFSFEKIKRRFNEVLAGVIPSKCIKSMSIQKI